MSMTEMTSPHATSTGNALRHLKAAKLSASRKTADDELWTRLDQKLAERDMARQATGQGSRSKGFLMRLINGMGIKGR